jgi:hypothetical protein
MKLLQKQCMHQEGKGGALMDNGIAAIEMRRDDAFQVHDVWSFVGGKTDNNLHGSCL